MSSTKHQEQQQRTETTPIFKPFPLDADSMTSNLWWADPCRGINSDPSGETALDVRIRLVRQSTALIDGHVKPLFDDFKSLLPAEFDHSVSYDFFPKLPSDEQNDNYFKEMGIPLFLRTALEMLECYAMLQEQVLCDQENHHPQLTPRIIQTQQGTRPLVCSCLRSMAFQNVEPNQAIHRSLIPNSFRTNTTMAECNKKCYCTLRDQLAALWYCYRGFDFWNRWLSPTDPSGDEDRDGRDGGAAGSGRRDDGKQDGGKTKKTDEEDTATPAGAVESRKG